MPIHNWSKVDANLFHDFHQAWAMQIRNTLNAGLLPPGYSALVEQHIPGLVPDVLAVERRSRKGKPLPDGGLLVEEEPKTRFAFQTKEAALAEKANRIAIRHNLGDVVCVIEIVSPGNKAGRHAFESFVKKSLELLRNGVNLLVVDLLPPTTRDPNGIHRAIWEDYTFQDPFEPPAGKPLTLAAYVAGDAMNMIETRAYVEPVGPGDVLPDMPAYLDLTHYVPIPLEATYQAAWATCPADMRYLVEHGKLPEEP
jgi:hypothetical protein